MNNILIVDDERTDVEPLLDQLQGVDQPYYIKVVSDLNHVIPVLKQADILIIDWKLAEHDDVGMFSIQYIRNFLEQKVAPVIIYTSRPVEVVEGVLSNAFDQKTQDLIKVVDKGSSVEDAVKEVRHALNNSGNYALKLLSRWRPTIDAAFNGTSKKIFGSMENEGITILIREFTLDEQTLDEAFRDVFANLLTTELQKFETEMDPINTPLSNKEIEGGYGPFVWFDNLRRYAGASGKIQTGDLVDLGDGNYGLVITPICDLTRPNDKTLVKLLMGVDLKRKCVIEGMDGESETVAKEDLKVTLEKLVNSQVTSPSKKEEWLYHVPINSQSVTIVLGFESVLTIPYHEAKEKSRPVRLMSPYIDEVLHGYTRYYLRTGLPAKPFREKSEQRSYKSVLVQRLCEDYGLEGSEDQKSS